MVDLPRVIGHRGAAAYRPENTLAAFAHAAELGCAWVEFDVRLTRDDVPVVVHDRSLLRTAGVARNIDDVHSRQLADIDAGGRFDPFWSGERIPTLAQALDACLVLGLTPNIELKADAGGIRTAALAVAGMLRERWPADRPAPLVSSFSPRMLYHMRSAGGRLALGLLMRRRPRRFWAWHARVLGCATIHVDPSLATPAFVERARRRGRRVAVYTVNDRARAERLFEAGVDAVFSDRPDLMAPAARGTPAGAGRKDPVSGGTRTGAAD